MIWEEMTYDTIDAVDRDIPVFINVAAIEQHGRHLPVGTDALAGQHILQQLHEIDPNAVLVLPQVKVCCSSHHLDFNGTLSISHTTMLAYVTELLGCVVDTGFRNVVIMNSHGGNQAIGQVILETLGYRYPATRFVFVNWWTAIREELRPLNESGEGGVGHACEFETSMLLHMAPGLVRADQIGGRSFVPSYPWATGDLLRGSKASVYRSIKTMSNGTGIVGDPSFATAAKGEQIFGFAVEAMRQIATDLRNAP